MFNIRFISFLLLGAGALSSVSATVVRRRAATSIFPIPPATSSVSAPIRVKAGSTFTPAKPYTRFDRGAGPCNGQTEGGQGDAVFLLEEGATLERVVIGKDQSEGIHCLGSCTLNYVFFETSGTSRVNYGGAKWCSTMAFYVENFGKLYRSIRLSSFHNINDVTAVGGTNLVGINSNLGDTATIRRTKASNVKVICQKFNGNSNGAEPTKAMTAQTGNPACLLTLIFLHSNSGPLHPNPMANFLKSKNSTISSYTG
ncbi:pectin lyase fold/virulence factor [Crucibulum laeve]|uniref:Pectate lyase n=1 Tax=Crucibulum laeve TaxID=68775 RepID=A0A5C3M580_9AGAR|nr:pectin lyase fold/virulence factor [Crucibulum laeve]